MKIKSVRGTASAVRPPAPERDTHRVNVMLPKSTRATGNVPTPLRTNFALRCNPLLAKSSTPRRLTPPATSTMLFSPHVPQCSSIFEKHRELAVSTSSHSSGCFCSEAHQTSRFSEKGVSVETKFQSEVSGLRFSIRTVEDLPAPSFVTASVRLQFPVRSSVHDMVVLTGHKEPQFPEPRSKCALLLPITSDSPRNSHRLCGCEKTSTAAKPRTFTASSSSFGTHTGGLVSVHTPGRGRADCSSSNTGSAPGRSLPTSSSSHKSKHVGTGGVRMGLGAFLATHSSERCGEWPPPAQARSRPAHVATVSEVVVLSSALRSQCRRGLPP